MTHLDKDVQRLYAKHHLLFLLRILDIKSAYFPYATAWTDYMTFVADNISSKAQ